MGNDKDTPGQKHAAHILRDRKSLDQEIGWDSPEEISEIENRSYPGVLLSFEPKIWDE